MSKTHPVVFSFGGAEHHLTLKEAGEAVGRLNAAYPVSPDTDRKR
ncbi:MAG TPA: hypothetical protein VMH39_02545 [Gemmatimonadaceae bacterium]|nr:hypothetical protein [Gemmatimonadaceae bacterium]